MAKFLDSDGVSRLIAKLKALIPTKYAGSPTAGGIANKTMAIPLGHVDSGSTATVMTATVDGITKLEDGVCCYIQNGVVTSASGWTLNVNGLGAKPVYSTLAAASRTTTLFNVNYTMLFVYNSTRVSGGCWDIFYGYDSNTNTIGYQIRRNNGTYLAKGAVSQYKLLFTYSPTQVIASTTSTGTGTSKTMTTESFDPFGAIFVYTASTTVANGSAVAIASMWEQYTVDIRYSFNVSNITNNKDVYVKCSPQSDGKVKLATSGTIVQALPTTDDGYVYIHLGHAYSTTAIVLALHHPVYYYKDGAIRAWTNAKDVPTKTSELTNDSGFITSASIPTKVSELTNDAGYTTNVGTITGITMNGVSQGTSGVVDLGNVMTGRESDYVRSDALATAIEEDCRKKIALLYVNGSSVAMLNSSGDSVSFLALAGYWIPSGLEVLYVQILNGATDFTQANARLYELTDMDMTTASIRLTSVEDGTIYTADLQDTGSGLVGTISSQTVPTKTSDLTNTSGFITSDDVPESETDPTVPAWAKASSKPTYTASEVGALANTGGEVSGDVTLKGAAASNSPSLIFLRGTLTDNYNDWRIQDRGGYLYFDQRGSGSTTWSNVASINTNGQVTASSFNGSLDWAKVTNKPTIPTAGLDAVTDWYSVSGTYDADDAPLGLTRTRTSYVTSNLPSGIGNFGFLFTVGNDTYAVQTYYDSSANGITGQYTRFKSAGTWYPWTMTGAYPNANGVSY